MVAFLALVFGFATVLRVLFWMATHPLSWYKKKDRSSEEQVVAANWLASGVLSSLIARAWFGSRLGNLHGVLSALFEAVL